MKRTLAQTIGALAVAVLPAASTFAQVTGFNQTAAGIYDYNNTANWVGGNINGIWDASLTLAGAQTNTFAATPATATGLTFGYAGNFPVTLESSSTTPQTFNLGGDISLSTSGGTSANVTIGNTANPLNMDLGGVNRTITVATGRTLTIANSISGAGFGITNAGAGTLTLNGTNSTYSGGITLNAGTLQIGSGFALGTGLVTANGGTLKWSFVSGNATVTNNIVVNSATTFDVASGNWTQNGNISGSGTITRGTAAALSLVLGGDNSGYTGTFTNLNVAGANNNAVVRFSATSAGSANAGWVFNNTSAGKTTLDFAGNGTISFGSLTGAGQFQANAAGIKIISAGALGFNDTFSGIIANGTGTIGLTKVGSGTMTLSGVDTYTGPTTISAGTLTIGGAGQLGGGNYGGNIINNSSLIDGSSAANTLSGPISGSGNLTMNGSGVLTLSGACTSTGNLAANAGTLVLASSQSFSPSTVGISDGAILNETFSPSVQMTPSSVTIGLTTGATIGFVANSTSVARITAGTLTFNGANTINIVGGNLVAGSSYPLIAYTTLSGSGTYALGALPTGVAGNLSTVGNTIYFNVTGVTNTIWTGAVNGTWDINTTANWTNSGTLGNKYINGSPVQFDDTGLNTTTISNSVATTLSPISVLVTNKVNNYAFKTNVIIAGAASLTKTGTANLTNSTANTYTGSTTINQGQLVVGVASVANVSGALGNNSAVSLANDSTAVLNLNNFATQIGSLSGGGLTGGNVTLGSATLTVGADNTSSTYAGVVSGTGGISKIGTGTLTLSGAHTFTGGWSVNAGMLNYNGSLASGGQLIVNGNGANSIVNIGSGANLTFNNASPLIGNNATAAGALFQSGGIMSHINQFQLGAVTGGSYGYYSLSSGTNSMLEFDLGSFNGAAVGVCDISGGVINVTNWFVPSRGTSAIGILNMIGGAFNYYGPSGQFLGNWNGGAGSVTVLNISNASLIASNANVNLMQSGVVGKLGEINLLSGGFLQVNGIAPGSATGTSMLNFNGGTLRANTANTTFLTANNSSVNIYSGGGTINNNGVNITIPVALSTPAGSGLNDSVTLNSGGSGYIGAPAVTFTNGGGTGATAYATISGGAVTGVVITSPGVNYSSTPTIVFTGGGGTGASATAPTPTANTSGGMTFMGSGTTTLNGLNTYAGGTKVLSGTLAINTTTGGAQGGGDLVISNAALNINAGGGTALSGGNLTLQGTNVLTLAPSVSSANSSATCINLSGALSNSGTNSIFIGGTGFTVGTYHLITVASGTVSTNNFILAGLPAGAQGMLVCSTPTTLDFVITSIGQVLSWFGNPSSTPDPWDIGITADWTADGGNSVTTYNQYLTNTVGDLVIFGQQGANTTSTNYVNLVTNVVPASVTFNWVYPYVLTGSGSIGGATSLVITDNPVVYLGTSNSYTGGTFIYGGSLTITNDDALGASTNGVTLGSDSFGASSLQLNGVTSARNFTLVGNSSFGVISNTSSVLSGNINSTATLTKSGGGSLTLSGIVTNTGSLEFLTGTGAISGTVTVGGELWGGASSDSNNFGVLNIQPGANVTVTSWIVAGRGNYGILNMNGGTLTKGGDNTTHLTMTGAGSGETGILNLNGGLIQDTTGDCWLGEQFTSIVNQNGGTLANTGGSVYMGRYTTANSTYNLNGGLLQTRSIIGNFVAVSNAVFNFNGGTLQAAASSTAFMQGLTAAYVTTNGAIIDTTNFNITIPQALADDPISGPGNVVKQGTGILTLSGSNTISGLITINQGTLLVTPAEQGTSNVVTVATSAAYGVQLTAGPGSVTNAAITLGSVSNTLSFALGTNGNVSLPLLFCGALTNNGTLNVAVGANSSFLTVGSVIPLMHYAGGILGSLNPAIIAPRGSSMTLSNDTTGHTLYAVINSLSGGIVWTGTNSAPGLTNLWDINSTTNWLIAGSPTTYQEGALPPGDAVLFNDFGSGTVLLSNTVNPTSVTISNSVVNYNIQGTGQINSIGGLAKLGTGTATLNLAGTYSASTVVSNGTLNLGANQTFANLTGNGTISTVSGLPTLTENSSANTTFNGSLQGGLGLTKTGAGSLTLSGASTYTSATLVNAGTLNVSGAVGSVASSAVTTVGGASGNAILAVSGTLNQKNLFAGNASGAVGAVYQSSGTVTVTNGGGDNLCVGNISGGFGYYNLSGGTVLAGGMAVGGENNSGTGFSGTGGNGILDINGGFLNDIGWVVAARAQTTAAETGIINVFNGVLAYAGGGIVNCWGSGGNQIAIVNILGGTVTNSIDVGFNLNQNGNANNVGILNLNGGLTQANGVIGNSAQVNFGGGTLRASKATGTYINGIGSANVYSGGGTIDNNGFNITIPQALVAPAGSGVSISSFTAGGSGYIAPPIVTVTNGGGSGATAIAQIDVNSGVITNVIITCAGVSYTGTPTLNYSGGGGTGTPTVVLTTTANISGGMTFQGAGTTTLTGVNTYTGNTIVSNGTLLVNGSITGAATTANSGTLGGIGTLGATLVNNATLFPGTNGIGTLTVNGNITLNAGSTNTFNVNGSTSAHNTVAAGGAVNYGGVLNIVPGGTFTLGQQFQLFNGAGAASASNFGRIAGNPGSGLAFSFTNGVLSVVNGGPTGPATITNNVSGNILALSWSSGQGWRLQMQTNSLSTGLGTNWVYITDGSISSTNITIDQTKPTVFYRLVYP